MTPKDKAKELYDKFDVLIPAHPDGKENEIVKKCVIACIDEIVKEKEEDVWMGTGDNNNPRFWIAVKQEIENL